VRAALEAIAYEFQKYNFQRLADLHVAEAELERLLTRDSIDLDAVRAKIRDAEAIGAGIKIRQIESLLKAVNTLTHEQHLKVVILIQELQAPSERAPAERRSPISAAGAPYSIASK
jgi:Spy/CpxP family protein refolding chaperone